MRGNCDRYRMQRSMDARALAIERLAAARLLDRVRHFRRGAHVTSEARVMVARAGSRGTRSSLIPMTRHGGHRGHIGMVPRVRHCSSKRRCVVPQAMSGRRMRPWRKTRLPQQQCRAQDHEPRAEPPHHGESLDRPFTVRKRTSDLLKRRLRQVHCDCSPIRDTRGCMVSAQDLAFCFNELQLKRDPGMMNAAGNSHRISP
jgi:hypothetical protein